VIPRLWYITDRARGTGGRSLPQVIEQGFAGGVGAVVLREPGLADHDLCALARSLAPLRRQGLLVLVSRRLDLAAALELDGVHLAADAVPVTEARAFLGPQALIGYSAHAAVEAQDAARAGANYVTLSPVYPTESKPGAAGRGTDWLREAVSGLAVPALALGGVTAETTGEVLNAGAWGVAAVSALGAAPDVAAAARSFRATLEQACPPAAQPQKNSQKMEANA
jgi:thiamine-phosphate pyrophosphorylase